MANDKHNSSTDTAGQGDAPALTSGLYIVATPIGNLRDITLRALDTLRAADLIACEDTRVTGVLLSRFGISTRKTPYHDFSDAGSRRRIIEVLDQGGSVALVSDAGSPLIADPGYKLVLAVTEAGHAVYPVPGASAAIAGLQASALPTDRVLFAGFLPAKKQARRQAIASVAALRATLVFYETPKRLAASLVDLADMLGPDRPASVSREITKLFEEHRRGSLGELLETIGDMPKKGELVVTIGPPLEDSAIDPAEIDRLLNEALAEGGVKQAAAEVAGATGLSKRELYARAVALRVEANAG